MMQVACNVDAAYLPHCAAMLHSLLAQHPRGAVQVHLLHDADTQGDGLTRLEAFVQAQGGAWRAHCITTQQRALFPDHRRFKRTAWYRVLLPELLPDYERVLYLDTDMIVLRPLDALWATDLNEAALAAVTNPLYPFMDHDFLGDLGLRKQAEYFNSGVLLINLDYWRRHGVMQHILDFAAEQGRSQEWPDQNALNVVLRDNWRRLAPEWNAQNTVFDLPVDGLPFSKEEALQARRSPAIVHFIGPYKPWHYRCKHPLRALYWHHLAQTPWPERSMEGRSLANYLLRPLPEQWGWRLEAWLWRLRGRYRSWL